MWNAMAVTSRIGNTVTVSDRMLNESPAVVTRPHIGSVIDKAAIRMAGNASTLRRRTQSEAASSRSEAAANRSIVCSRAERNMPRTNRCRFRVLDGNAVQ